MKPTLVRASGPQDARRVVFDQESAGIDAQGRPARAVVRADGKTVLVNGALKVVKDAIERGDLIDLSPKDDAPAKAEPAKP